MFNCWNYCVAVCEKLKELSQKIKKEQANLELKKKKKKEEILSQGPVLVFFYTRSFPQNWKSEYFILYNTKWQPN